MDARIVALLLGAGCATTPQPSAQMPEAVDEDFALARAYEEGEKFRYRLTVESGMAGGETTTVVSVSSHEVEREGEAFVERVNWESLHNVTSGEDRTAHAKNLPTQTFSLDSKWAVELAPPQDEKMVSPVMDLFTFYVSASRFSGAGKLRSVGDQYTNPELIKGDWSAGQDTKLGRDCVRLTVELVELTDAVAKLRARYEVPDEACWPPSHPWMGVPVDGTTPNNFEQVKKSDQQWMALWGYESFELQVTVDRKSGQILSGEMHNPLEWHGRACIDEALTKCGDVPPMKYLRTLKLELMDT